MSEEKSRRGFLEILLGSSAVMALSAVLYPIFKFITPPKTAEANLSQLKLSFTRAEIELEAQKAKYFKYGKALGIIFINEKNQLKAMDATCTHLDCTVQHRPDLGILWCSCHNGRYGLDGTNISGPPPRPLSTYAVKEVDDVIFVSKGDS
ncbi:MAG: ubiquinol-cytochrome c reductase iron-sulfur subunit [Calditrichaeota bacterium]|nr:MAG: ubiquinol-cytochrome c reductase iron-sulfur subunit [Calditrichota bacterium]